jgi:hypothetical protein
VVSFNKCEIVIWVGLQEIKIKIKIRCYLKINSEKVGYVYFCILYQLNS